MISSRRSMLRLWCSLAAFALVICWILPQESLVAADKKSKSKPRFSRKSEPRREKKQKSEKSPATKKGPSEAKSKANSPEAALEEARKTGRPILAMAGSNSCGYCQAMVKRLDTDRSLQPLLKKYVPLKIDVNNDKTFGEWMKKYPFSSTGGSYAIPVVYVIRADGEAIYAQPGYPEGKLLTNILRDGIKKSGTILTPKKLDELESSVAKAKSVSKEEGIDKVVEILASVDGRDGFSEAALEAKELLQSVSGKSEKRLEIAEEGLKDESFLTLGALALIEVENNYAQLPEVKEQVEKLMKAYKKTSAGRAALAKAKTW